MEQKKQTDRLKWIKEEVHVMVEKPKQEEEKPKSIFWRRNKKEVKKWQD